ncbi:MAG: MFS transporter [Turicibacter sp.]|nr:MFS transporter [Turicibacter sp.]
MKEKLTLGRMWAFAVGDIFGGGSFNIINFLYPGFLALVVGIPAHLAGVIMLVGRLFDAVTDPLMGLFSDRLRQRFGTRRVSLFVSAPLITLSMFLMFYPYQHPSQTVRFWQLLTAYIFFYLVQTSVMIPYFSLASEMTDDYTLRAKMTTLRMGCAISASIICVAVPGMIVDASGSNQGYIYMSLAFGTLFGIVTLITAFFAKEGVAVSHDRVAFEANRFWQPFKVKPFRQYLWLFLCCQLTMAIMSALFFFYVDFYFRRGQTALGQANMVGIIGAALMFGMQIVALPVYMALIRKVGKMAVYIVGSLIWIVGALLLFWLPADADAWLLYLLAAALGFGISGPGLVPHAIFGDVVDVGTLQLGVQVAGAFSGIANLVNKLAQAIGLALVMAALGWAGFLETQIGPDASPVLQQPLAAQRAIVTIMALAPLAFMSVGIFVGTRYRLNKERHEAVLKASDGTPAEKMAVLESL